MTQRIANPLTTDPAGRFGFWAPAGQYIYSASTPTGTLIQTVPITLGGSTFSGGTGQAGAAATVDIAGAVPLAYGQLPTVVNKGTSNAASLLFGIPIGATGATGQTGPKGDKGDIGPVGPMGSKGDPGATTATTDASLLTSGLLAVARLPLATLSAPGAVQPDGTTTTISGGVISAVPTPANTDASKLTTGTLAAARLPLATTSVPGAVQPDGSSVTITGGVISAVTGTSSPLPSAGVRYNSGTGADAPATSANLIAALGAAPYQVNYVAGYPSSCTVGGVSYTTQLDCAFYQTVANGGSEIVLGTHSFSGAYTTNAGLVEPLTGTQISIKGQTVGFNRIGSTIKAGAAMQAVISHADVPSGTSTPYNLLIEDVAIDANNLAQQCLALYAEKEGVRRNITCTGGLSSTKAWVEFGDASPPTGYSSGGYENITQDVYVASAGKTIGNWASVTATQSGGVPSITVNSGGSYNFPNPPAYLWGFQQPSAKSSSASVQPCTTMGTATAVMSGSAPPYTLTSVTLSGFSGCSGLLYASVPDMPPTPFGIEEAETDSSFMNMRVNQVGRQAGIYYYSGGNRVIGDHVYGGSPIQFQFLNPQVMIGGLEVDTPIHIGIQEILGRNIFTSTQFLNVQPGTVGFMESTANGSKILGSSCPSGIQASSNFNLMATPAGVIPHGDTRYQDIVLGALQCDDYSEVNFLPTIDTVGISVLGGGNVTTGGFGSYTKGLRSGSAANTDATGELALSAATSASYTFVNTYTSHPEVVVQCQFNCNGDQPWITYTGTTSFTVNFATAVTGTVTYNIVGRN